MARAGATTPVRYALKPGPYSSHSLLLAALPPQGHGRAVLDLGCGDGYLAGILAARGYSVTGVERPGGSVGPAPTGVRLIEADLDCGMPLLPQRYDFVLCADLLEHLKAPEKLLRELPRFMNPGARLLLSLPNAVNIYCRLNILFGRFPKHDRGLFDRTHLHFYTWSGWVELLAQAGFCAEKIAPSAIPFSLVFERPHSRLVRALEALSYVAARLWKEMFAYQFIVVARWEGSR